MGAGPHISQCTFCKGKSALLLDKLKDFLQLLPNWQETQIRGALDQLEKSIKSLRFKASKILGLAWPSLLCHKLKPLDSP